MPPALNRNTSAPAHSMTRRFWLFGHTPRALPSEHPLPFLSLLILS
jgi:hypothetical protein